MQRTTRCSARTLQDERLAAVGHPQSDWKTRSRSRAAVGFSGAVQLAAGVNLKNGCGLLSIATAVAGSGTLAMVAAGTLSLLDGAAAGQTADFPDCTGLLHLTKAMHVAGQIDGFSAGGRIDLVGTVVTGDKFANGVRTVKDGGKTVASLHLGGSYTQSDFILVSEGHGSPIMSCY
jgi:hypothetical protein